MTSGVRTGAARHARRHQDPNPPSRQAAAGACFALVAIAWIAQLFLRETYPPGHPLRLAVTAMLTACVALLAWTQVRVIRSQDEFPAPCTPRPWPLPSRPRSWPRWRSALLTPRDS
jgi:hypothetical protein